METHPIIFGTSSLGNLYQALPKDVKVDLVRNILKHGGPKPILDSAGKYGAGLALETLGEILRELEVTPDSISISNKLAWKRVPLEGTEPTFEPGVWVDLEHDAVCDISYEGIMDVYQQGIELIGEPYHFDFLSIHDPDEFMAEAQSKDDEAKRLQGILEGYRALAQLKSEGKTKAIGVGTKDWRIIPKITEKVNLDWVMLACSLTPYTHDPDLVSFIQDLSSKGVTIVNSAVFNGGFLVGGDHFDYQFVTPETHGEIFSWRQRFKSICEKFQINPAVVCVQFGMELPGVSATALNTTDPGKVKRNVASGLEKVPHQLWDELIDAKLIDPNFPFPHRRTNT